MEIKRQKNKRNNRIFDYELTDGDKSLNIMLNRDGDLFWLMDTEEPADYAFFNINKDNQEIYSLFENLYSQIMAYKEGRLSEDLEYTSKDEEALKASLFHQLLTRDGNITWISDCDSYEEGDALTITKTEEGFMLEFLHQVTNQPFIYRPGMFDIGFSKENSRYAPFNKLFMDMYLKLQKYDPKFHQVHIDEIKSKEKSMTK